MKVGDKVKIISGEYKGAIGYITSILRDYVTVEPDTNADRRIFYKKEVKVIK